MSEVWQRVDDEDREMRVSMRVVEWLRQNGHNAVHLRDRGLERLPNGGIFAMAVEENRVVLTFDLDFGEIVALSRGASRTCH